MSSSVRLCWELEEPKGPKEAPTHPLTMMHGRASEGKLWWRALHSGGSIPHGGLRTFHKKPTCPETIDLNVFSVTNWVTLHPDFCTVLLGPRDPLLHSERTLGFTADPDYWKGQVCVYVGRNQNLKDLKDLDNDPLAGPRRGKWPCSW